ncbi:MAG: hypothetical protein JWM57_2439 [Phycisphaerales bacterium]|nr:hypothetical protein [Phycisphaerales bacterium]
MTDFAPVPIVPAPLKKRGWLAYLKLALLVLVLALVTRVLIKQWRQIADTGLDVHVQLLPLVGTALMLMAVAVIQAISYRTLLGAYATAPAWRAMPTIAWVPPMGKYIPGGAVVAAVAMLRRLSIPVGVAVAVVLVQDGLAQLAGLIVSAPLLWWQPVAERVPWAKWLAFPAIIAAVVCLWPSVFAAIINALLKFLKRSPLPRTPAMAKYLVPMLCAFFQWVLHGAALGFIVQSVTGHSPWGHFPLLMSFAALSQTLGYLAFFAPGGLGVREAVLLACLTPLSGVGPLAAVIVPIRAVSQVLIDLLMGTIGLSLARATRAARTVDSSPVE